MSEDKAKRIVSQEDTKSRISGCELLNCKYYKDGVCTDTAIRYTEVCRYHPSWDAQDDSGITED